jgi:RNA polymerase sigma-70 factor (ECF subfamily)
MKTDEEWMREYRSGSEEAFGVLYDKYASVVYGYLRRRLRESEVEDQFQKVWRQLHEKRGLYKDQPFAPWLFVLVKHLLIDDYRSRGRRDLAAHREEIIDELYTQGPDQGDEVDALLAKLSPESRDLVRRYYLDGVGYDELAAETGLSQTNLRQRLSRAIRGLRGQREG